MLMLIIMYLIIMIIVKTIKIYKIGFLEKAVDFEDVTRLFYNICRFLNVCCVGQDLSALKFHKISEEYL